MAKYVITKENVAEIRTAMEKEKNVNLYRRMQAVALRGEGKDNKEIAEITKYDAKYVNQLLLLHLNVAIFGGLFAAILRLIFA